MLRLRYDTPRRWVDVVEASLDEFLQDHAANERKVSASAMKLVVQHPDRAELVAALIDVAEEEMEHFRLIYRLLIERGSRLAQDEPDPYMTQLRKRTKHGDTSTYLLDRLLLFGIVEARGCERFSMLGEGLSDAALRAMYTELAQSEARHHSLYYRLAKLYFDDAQVQHRAGELLDLEASVMRDMPLRPRLH
jgi:tRNA-(ms[2]io[6]A)-hydroxylase